MKIQRIKKRSNKLAYLPVLIIMLSLTIITVSTFAFFSDKGGASGIVNFGKVELSDGTSAGVTKTLYDVLPGDAIIDNTLSFSKSSDSESIFVRAKLSFSTDSTDETVATFLSTLRGFDASDFGISNTEIGTTGAKWSAKTGNYVYLVNADDATTLFNVTDTTTFALSNSIVVPTGLTQSVDEEGESTFAHYMESIKFNFAFQAIQSSNVDNILATTSATFSEAFPESASEVILFVASFDMGMSSLPQAQDITTNASGQVILPSLPVNSTAPTGLVAQGTEEWYWRSANSGELYSGSDIITLTASDSFDAVWGTIATESMLNFSVLGSTATVTGVKTGSLTNLIIPETVTVSDSEYTIVRIAANAFNECFTLTSIEIPDSITDIGEYAFYYCTNLSSLSLPNSITNIGNNAFYYCTNLESLTLSESITIIGDGVFTSCSKLTTVVIPNNVTEIKFSAFMGCSELTTVILSTNLVTIGEQVFQSCSKITSIIIPVSVATIGNFAFYACGITTVNYTGTEAEWTTLTASIGSSNEALLNAIKVYNYVS